MDNRPVAGRLSLRWASRIEESRTDVSILTGFKKIPKTCTILYYKIFILNRHDKEIFRLFMEHRQGVYVNICIKPGL